MSPCPETTMKKELWLRLRQYQFADIVPTRLWDRVNETFGGGDASTRAFARKIASKIARKHGWSTRFALRAISEYRKFVFLKGLRSSSRTVAHWYQTALRVEAS